MDTKEMQYIWMVIVSHFMFWHCYRCEKRKRVRSFFGLGGLYDVVLYRHHSIAIEKNFKDFDLTSWKETWLCKDCNKWHNMSDGERQMIVRGKKLKKLI